MDFDYDALYRLTPVEFEHLVAALLEADGHFKIFSMPALGGEGADFIGEYKGEHVLVEAKHKQRANTKDFLQVIRRAERVQPTPKRLIIVTSAKVANELTSQLTAAAKTIAVTVIDRDGLAELLKSHPAVAKRFIVPADKRTRRQRLDLWVSVAMGVAAALAGYLSVAERIQRTRAPLNERIETVGSALDNLKSLEQELINIKKDMEATQRATKAIEEQYARAKELEKLTKEDLETLKVAMSSETWMSIAWYHVIGFAIGVASSIVASILRDRWQQRRALNA